MTATGGGGPEFFRGAWLEPSSRGFEEARQVFNRRIDPHPEVIARCTGVADVISAVAYARDRGLTVDVRATGYKLAGGKEANGLVVDLSPMRAVQVLPHRRIARIQGGTRGGDIQIEAGLHGLGATTGVLSGSGVGLMLGGGLGYLSSRTGWAGETILAVELVTADGTVVTASPDENPDLFWAVRGSTGNFGVVTALEVQLQQLPPLVHTSALTWSLGDFDRAAEALRSLPEWASEDLSLVSQITSASLDGRGGYEMFACHSGPAEQARAELDRLRSFGSPDGATAEVPFRDLHFVNDEMFAPTRVILDEQPVSALGDELIDAFLARMREPHGEGMRTVEITPRFGAFGRDPEFPSALREAAEQPTWSLGPGAWWEGGGEDAAHLEWTGRVMEDIRRIGPAEGTMHLNTVAGPVDLDDLRRMYGDRLQRLRELKRRWDPDNLFSGTHNIPPAGD